MLMKEKMLKSIKYINQGFNSLYKVYRKVQLHKQ